MCMENKFAAAERSIRANKNCESLMISLWLCVGL